jgi:hypothetical protein
VRLLLAGGSVLEERFASPKLDSFNQRLAARCYLDAFNRTETQAYIRHQITFAGGQAEALFCDETCQTVFQATGGVPRLINQVCDHAMLLSYVGGRQQVSPADVEEAWADLQQLPTPWNGEAKTESTSSGVIEFGSLDDAADGSAGTNASGAASEPAVPALRISPALDDGESSSGEPAQQIHRIEQLLAEADDDFQPAGSIVPEIELHFEEPSHPFTEEFEHEEVISDRYAIANRSVSGGRLRPPSTHRSGAGIFPLESIDSQPPRRDKSPFPPVLAPTPRPAPATSVNSTPELDAPPSEPIAATPEPATDSQALEDEQGPCSNSEKNPPTDSGETGFSRPATKEPVAPARRPEYRRLFARLRRG